ncbi:hypothetical protein QR98_0094020 [Sarcoptes scabiei]|uniref:Uncharacterized protein n=1 Tax=Sarcoptes scabiei TaxID=52283 RepID=A0A132AJ45_SARSC|nr:hypothetical protein QR98_0094020 [Sarcoptes scabiei]
MKGGAVWNNINVSPERFSTPNSVVPLDHHFQASIQFNSSMKSERENPILEFLFRAAMLPINTKKNSN